MKQLLDRKKSLLAYKRSLRSMGEATAISLPYTFTPPAGAWSAPWTAPTWNAALNTPTLGSELLTDGGLEANYTAGLCDSLQVTGSPTVSQSADVHGGTKAQAFTGAASNDELYFPAVTPTAHTWYLFSVWAKRLSGANDTCQPRLAQASGTPQASSIGLAMTDAAYTKREVVKRAANTNNMSVEAVLQNGATSDAVLIDDCSLKVITPATLFALIDSGITDHVARTRWTWDKDSIAGVVARADVASNPQNFLVAYYWTYSNSFTYCVLDQCVAGVYTNLIADWSNSPGAGGGDTPTNTQWLEIRVTGNTAGLFHNNIQVGTNQAINAALATNTFVGTFSSGGGSQLASFFVDAS